MPKRDLQSRDDSIELGKEDNLKLFSEDALKEKLIEDSESEESEYSGLEEEESTSDEEEDSDLDADSLASEGDSGDEEEPENNNREPRKQIVQEEDGGETSDEEDVRNTIGNVPIEWYNEYPHIGYDLEGKRIIKPATGDELDTFLSKMDDPNFWRTVKDKQTMREVVLTDEELDIINRIQNKRYPAGTDPYEPYGDLTTHEKMIHPVSSAPEPKSRFIPSKWEHKRVIKIVRAIRNGWIKPKKTDTEKPRYYMLWDDSKDEPGARHSMHIPAPKMKLPGHEESYNPPPEYLPTPDEIAAWEAMDPEDRPRNFIPKKYSSLRLVPGYNNFIQERFERCLDLYLCPRQRKMRLNVNPEDLIPKLPKPKDLRPFPSVESIVYRGHTGAVYCTVVDPSGQWLASGSEDESLKIWEVATGRCLKTVTVTGPIRSLAWNPNPSLCLLAVAVGQSVLIVNAGVGDEQVTSSSDDLINGYIPPSDEDSKQPVPWNVVTDEQRKETGLRLEIIHPKEIKQVTWHVKGDYFAVVVHQGGNQSVIVHQLSKRRSQCPFKKAKGLIQCVLFHPTRPFLFVATQSFIRVYNLMKQELAKKLISNVKWISSMAIHPKGDNLLIGSYDRRLCWFDMDLSVKPYKVLRHHKKALRQVAYHPRYPLFASASDDGTVIICHGMVYNDLLQNPLIVPVKVIKGHEITKDIGVLDCVFHPSQPWIFTSGSDHTIRLFT